MNYQDTIQWLYSQLPMYQRQGKQAFKKDLANIIAFDEYMGQPSLKFKSIHVAGTNGKGSVSHFLASILQESGYKTGLYTSPHLTDFRERIRINGQMIRKNCVINFVKRYQKFFDKHRLSFFEMTVGLAFEHFAKKQVDIAVVETGLGGRLDSTNIIHPELSIITNIGLDHTNILGDNLAKIAREKSGIIKQNIPVVIGRKQLETFPVFEQVAHLKNAPLIYAKDFKANQYESGLKGSYQQENIRTVIAAINELRQQGWQIPESALKAGLKNVVKNTGLHGRWDILQTQPVIIADTAHNQDGITAVIKQLLETPHNNLHMILSFVNDKDLDLILPLFPKKANYYFSKAQIPRALDEKILQQKAVRYDLTGQSFPSIDQAFQAAKQAAGSDDLIFVGGSTFTVAEVLSIYPALNNMNQLWTKMKNSIPPD